MHVMEGGGNFRANFGVERDGKSLLAGDGSHSKGSDLTTGYPEMDHLLLKKLGWWADLTEAEQKAAEGKNWKTDPSGGIIRVAMQVHGVHPFGNARARAVVWNFPDPIPQQPGRSWWPSTRHTTTARPSGACPRCSRRCRRRTRTWGRSSRSS